MFPNHPWDAGAKRKEGVMLWTPHTIDGLVRLAQENLGPSGSRLLSEDGATVQDVDMVSDGQKLYLVGDKDTGESGE